MSIWTNVIFAIAQAYTMIGMSVSEYLFALNIWQLQNAARKI